MSPSVSIVALLQLLLVSFSVGHVIDGHPRERRSPLTGIVCSFLDLSMCPQPVIHEVPVDVGPYFRQGSYVAYQTAPPKYGEYHYPPGYTPPTNYGEYYVQPGYTKLPNYGDYHYPPGYAPPINYGDYPVPPGYIPAQSPYYRG